MGKFTFSATAAAILVSGCASVGESMSPEQLAECLQPNRRVVVEVGGTAVKPVPKPKPDAPPPKPDAKPPKPQMVPVAEQALAQGNYAFDIGGASLKDVGRTELNDLIAMLKKRSVNVGSVIISGHTDRLEARNSSKTLSEDRARTVRDYLVSQGIDQKVIFWEGKGDREPVPVTKFCS